MASDSRIYAEGYDVDEHRQPLLAFYLNRWRQAGSPTPLLEPMCGTGFFLIPFLEAGADIDGLDAAHAMGTGVPEVGGYTVRDAQVMIRSLRGKNLVGGDICEVAPMFDPTGQTALNAANLLFEMLCVIAGSRARRSR